MKSVPSPLPVLVAGIGDALPVEWTDRIECGIDNTDAESLRVVVRGRPLSPDLDLASQLDRFKDSLNNQGWSIESSEIDFNERVVGQFTVHPSRERSVFLKWTLQYVLDE